MKAKPQGHPPPVAWEGELKVAFHKKKPPYGASVSNSMP